MSEPPTSYLPQPGQEPQYQKADFCRDFVDLLRVWATHTPENYLEGLMEWQLGRYGMDSSKANNVKRAAAAAIYFSVHRHELNAGDGIVLGKDRAMMSDAMTDAFYHVFSSIPIGEIDNDFPVSRLFDLVKGHKPEKV